MCHNQKENIHILVVEDEEAIREIMQRAIKNSRDDCVTAGNAEEALQILDDKNIEVVVKDIVMRVRSNVNKQA